MPMITIEKNEDWLDAYKRYKKTVWYKRIKPKQWVMFGIVIGLAGALLWSFLPSILDFNFGMGFSVG